MTNLGDCVFCKGTGKCEECGGSGVKPLDASACSHCSGTGACPECKGTGKSSYWRQRRPGNLLLYGVLWAAGLIGLFALMAISRFFMIIGMATWTAFLFVLFSRGSQRKQSSPFGFWRR
jgi:hypothetical protein